MEHFDVVADYGDLCGEGPLWDDLHEILYWTDVTGRKFYRCHWPTRQHELVKQDIEINAVALDQSGGFIVTNSTGIWLWDGKSRMQLIAGEVEACKCQMNDSIADPAGRLFAGSVFYDPDKEYELGKLIRVETDGRLHIVDEGIHMANGLGFSPDCKTLYFTDSAARRIYAYDYNEKAGNVSHRRVLIQVPETEGLPDGMTVDSEGFIWSAQWYGSCVVRYDPDGKVERRITTPAKQTSSITFGGKDLTDIFITSAGQSEPLTIMPPNYDPYSGYVGGQLYHVNLNIPGKKEFRTNISVKS